PLLGVDDVDKVVAQIAVEKSAQHVGLEIPAIDFAAQIVGNTVERLVQCFALILLCSGGHSAPWRFVLTGKYLIPFSLSVEQTLLSCSDTNVRGSKKR